MKQIWMLLSRLAALFTARRLDAELDQEIRWHIESLEQEHRQRGLSTDEARAAALRDFGGVARTKDCYRDQRSLRIVDSLLQDLRHALRLARRTPGFSAVVALILALGIGANSAMFTFVNALLFRPLPGRAAQLAGLYSHDPTQPDSYRLFSYPDFADIRDRNDVFDELIAFAFAMTGTPIGDVMQQTFVEVVSANFFSGIGARLAAGRAFSPNEDLPAANIAVAIASYEAWRNTGFDPTFIGRTIRLNVRDFTIVGVAPQGFTGTTALIAPQYWVPLGAFESVVNGALKNNGRGLADRSNGALSVAGWLKPGVTMTQANERLAVLSADLERAYPGDDRHQLLTVHPLPRVNISAAPGSDAGPAALSAILMPLTGSVLLIACLNLANMLLARGTARKKEIAIRVALGGGRGRIVRQLLAESLVLALVGAAAGLLLGSWATRLLLTSLTTVMPVPIHFDPKPDFNIVIATTVFAVLSAVASGLAPALKMTRPDLAEDLKDLGGSRTAGRRLGTRTWLVVGQIAVSLMLMTAGGLFARGALRADVANPGYSYDGLLLASLDPSLAAYDGAAGSARVRAVVDRIRRLPGVVAAGANSQVPFGEFHRSSRVARIGQQPPAGPQPTYTTVTSGYFEAVRLPLLRGRDFTATEDLPAADRHVAIIDEPLVRRLFPDSDPLGQQIWIPPRDNHARTTENDPMTIVGIVPGIRDELTEREPVPHIYVPASVAYRGPMHVYTRTTGDERAMLGAIRREIRAVDDRLPVTELRTMREFHARGLVLWVIHTAGRTLMGLGLLALMLAATGVYGVKSYVVSQRTREIGIRLALGAAPRDIAVMLLKDGARMTLVGVALGFPMAVALGTLLSAAMFEVSLYDPLVLIAAPLVLAGAAALATYLPARRGMRVSPLDALRTE